MKDEANEARATNRSVATPRRKMLQTSDDCYIGEDNHRMQREYGPTPDGQSSNGRWVLRGPNAEWIDIDRYRNDLLARHGFVIDKK